jgi:sec-independent protein translocase protein TatA
MATILLFGMPGTGELILIGAIVMLLFGGKKIPELMRGIGQGINSFKKEVNRVKEEVDPEKIIK